jgi:hypothetical protein
MMTKEAAEALDEILSLLYEAGLTPADVANIGHALLGWGLSQMGEEGRAYAVANLPQTIDHAIELYRANERQPAALN